MSLIASTPPSIAPHFAADCPSAQAGVFAPLAKALETQAKAEESYLGSIKNALLSFSRGDAPITAVEFARRNIDPGVRPSFSEMESGCKNPSASGDVAKAA